MRSTFFYRFQKRNRELNAGGLSSFALRVKVGRERDTWASPFILPQKRLLNTDMIGLVGNKLQMLKKKNNLVIQEGDIGTFLD